MEQKLSHGALGDGMRADRGVPLEFGAVERRDATLS